MRAGTFWIIASALAAGCASTSGPRTAVERARAAEAVERQSCAGAAQPSELDALSRRIELVEPIYFVIQHGRGNREQQARGARLFVRAQPGVTGDALARAIACHQARVVLGRGERELASDPFVLPNGWVESSVEAEGGALVVTLRAPETPDADQLVARARGFAPSAALSIHP